MMKLSHVLLTLALLLCTLPLPVSAMSRGEGFVDLCEKIFDPLYVASFDATFPEFADVSPLDPHRGCFAALRANGIITPTGSPPLLRRDAPLLRGEFAKMLAVSARADVSPYRTKTSTAWHVPFMTWAHKHTLFSTKNPPPDAPADDTEVSDALTRSVDRGLILPLKSAKSASLSFGDQITAMLQSMLPRPNEKAAP